MPPIQRVRRASKSILLSVFWLIPFLPPAQMARAQSADSAEMTARDLPATFRSSVNLVMVPVIVRDRQGRAVGTLRKDDFHLADKGKPQTISRFSVENRGGRSRRTATEEGGSGASEKESSSDPGAPERFIAYLFDDVHTEFGDLSMARDAAGRHIDAMAPTDRAAIYTTSGQPTLEFTDHRAQLHNALLRLKSGRRVGQSSPNCMETNHYVGDSITNHHDADATAFLTMQIAGCSPGMDPSTLRPIVEATAQRALLEGEHESRVSLDVVNAVVHRLGSMPGQRILILVSPGLLAQQLTREKGQIVDRAIRANVTLSSLDARGLAVGGVDASQQMPTGASSQYVRLRSQLDRDAANARQDVLAELAYGTGGSFYHNSNDLDTGFKTIASPPEFVYVLGFAPQNLKYDGSFHALKVTLATAGSVEVQARRGYYAPGKFENAAAQAQEEIREALFSREEINELPTDVKTQFFKINDSSARVAVLVHVDAKPLRFRPADGRNVDTLTILAALFDRNGNYIVGTQKTLDMRLKDETLARSLQTGLTVRSSMNVQSGIYQLRVVVRDSEGQQMAARNSVVDIPF